jgi:hypothetical protein
VNPDGLISMSDRLAHLLTPTHFLFSLLIPKPMTLTGHHFIAGREAAPQGHLFHAFNPTTSAQLEPAFGDATHAEADEALRAADGAFDALRFATPETRALLLDAIADEITALGDALLERAHAECALPMARLTGERGRAIGQCKLFAALIREGSWANACVDHAIPDRQPLPKPDVRRVMLPIGPVVVFGASNFPFAIGVVGTDTVCALAAGCPVVVKGHPAHPGTCEMLARAVWKALHKVGLPAGCFSLVHGKGNDIGTTLVKHPLTQAVAFTGSLRGGRALMDVAAARPHPIPVYAEMGSVNPVFVLPGALKERASKIAEAYVGSVTMGVGQFCTNPAVVLGLQSGELNQFISDAAAHATKVAPQTMLHRGICEAYDAGTAVWQTVSGLELAGTIGNRSQRNRRPGRLPHLHHHDQRAGGQRRAAPRSLRPVLHHHASAPASTTCCATRTASKASSLPRSTAPSRICVTSRRSFVCWSAKWGASSSTASPPASKSARPCITAARIRRLATASSPASAPQHLPLCASCLLPGLPGGGAA